MVGIPSGRPSHWSSIEAVKRLRNGIALGLISPFSVARRRSSSGVKRLA